MSRLRTLFWTCLFCVPVLPVFGAHPSSLYFEWGYNKDWFSSSTLHFQGTDGPDFVYDFVVTNAKANDEFRGDRLVSAPFVPQYSYRIGYIFNREKGWGIEFNYDHSKYVLSKGETARATGHINETYFDTDTAINEPFLLFEHTNGANFVMINAVNEKTFHRSPNGKFSLARTLKAGGGVVVPKTYIWIDHHELDNDFHIAGIVAGVEAGLKVIWNDHVYLNAAGKACYANYYNALGLGDGKVSHHFFAYEALLTIGYQLTLGQGGKSSPGSGTE
jgi:hypothetical protein